MTRRNLMLLAAGGSLALLTGAYIFQSLGYAPCKLCLYQRWPHATAVVIGGLVLATGPFLVWGVLGLLSALATAGLGVYHSGVEFGWWEGPSTCTGGGTSLDALSGDQLLSIDVPVDIVMCDEVAWALAGISMAGWNAIFSLLLAALWFKALKSI
ncbi:MAG: disulfide bond formation protein B [Boseongicola sp.]|nr:MAG: disulfide bond formation protein B [Boseongicola sp.]